MGWIRLSITVGKTQIKTQGNGGAGKMLATPNESHSLIAVANALATTTTSAVGGTSGNTSGGAGGTAVYGAAEAAKIAL